jgi:hypothetical protein
MSMAARSKLTMHRGAGLSLRSACLFREVCGNFLHKKQANIGGGKWSILQLHEITR